MNSNTNQMPPEWIMFPDKTNGNIDQQTEYGEIYQKWLDSLTPQQLSDHKALFPEPLCWSLDNENQLRNNAFVICKWEKDESVYSVESISGKNDNNYIFFWGHHSKQGVIDKSCLSQWFVADFKIDGRQYNCMEQYMMSQKANLFDDSEICDKIMKTTDQAEIKSFGREIKNFDEATWNKFKFQIVLTGNYYKFSQNKELRNFLLNTGEAVLVEASPYDKIWGIGMSQDHKDLRNPLCWNGENLLGFALMQVRDEINRVWKNFDLIDWTKINQTK